MHDIVIFDILLKSLEAIVDVIPGPVDFLVNLFWLDHLDILTITRIPIRPGRQEFFVLCYQVL